MDAQRRGLLSEMGRRFTWARHRRWADVGVKILEVLFCLLPFAKSFKKQGHELRMRMMKECIGLGK